MTDLEASSNRPWAAWVRHGRHVIEDPDVAERLDRYLSLRFPYRSRTQWAELIRDGRIRVNGSRCRPSRLLHGGDAIDYEMERSAEPEVSFDIGILHEDTDLLAVDKPADLPVHPSGRYFRNTVLSMLLADRGETLDAPGIRIVHRLDRETSGVLVFGKTMEATRRLALQFERRTAEKTYLTLVHGVPETERFVVDRPLGRNVASAIRKAVGVMPEGEGAEARTEFEVAAAGSDHALLVARPRTGRMHQIRVHARSAGFPVVGDKMYGLDERFYLKMVDGEPFNVEDRARLLLDRQALHAWSLALAHPRTGERLEIRAPLPADMRELCEMLGVPISSGLR